MSVIVPAEWAPHRAMWLGFPSHADGTMNPADALPDRQGFRLCLLPCRVQWPTGFIQGLPAWDVEHSQRATPNTPAPVAWFLCPLIPTPCQPSQCDDTVGRCLSVYRGYSGFTGVAARCFAFTVQGHLSL